MKRILLTLLTMLTFGISASFAQAIVTGRVLDEKGQGLPGAGVSLKTAPSIGTITDLDGNFRLEAPSNATLVIQAVGYATQEIPASAAGTIRMQTAAKELSGAVVTALAIRREKREIGYSVTTIGSDELNAGNQTSALSALQGKTAGVNITSTTGGPGGSTRVVLRGEKSIGGSNNALIVVDGVPINNGSRNVGKSVLEQIDFGNQGNDINPEDIESITVLKGPAAAALYGSSGANGAVMITTKSGKGRKVSGKTDFTFQTSYTLSNVLKYPETQHKYGQGNVFEGVADDPRENFSWGLPFDGQLRPWGQEVNGQRLVKPYADQPDNLKRFYNTATTWENSLSMGGSTDKSSYYLSLNTLNNKGIVPNNFYDKYSVRFNGTTEFSNHFYSSINVNYLNIYSRVATQGQGAGSAQDALLQTPRDIPLWEAKDLGNPFYGYGFVDSTGVSRYGYYNNFAFNPYWTAENFDNRNRTDRILGNLVVGFKGGNWNVYNRFGADVVSDRAFAKIPKYNFVPYDAVYSNDVSYYPGYPRPSPGPGGYFEQTSNNINIYNDLIAQYTKQLTADIGFNGLAGGSLQAFRSNILSSDIDPTSNGLVIANYYSFTNATGPVQTANPISQDRSIGLYGSARVDWRRMVFLEMTARNDWTSTLAPGNRSFFYPSVSLSWIFTESLKNTEFVRNVLTSGKFRAAYASVGKGASAYQNNNSGYTRATVSSAFGTINFPFNGVAGYTYQNVIGNPALKPERTNSFEAGVELGFFRDRISLDVTYYTNKSIDQIVTTPVAPSNGFTGQVVNLGDVTNKGLELSARFSPIKKSGGLRWDIYGTYTKNTNEVTRLPNGVTRIAIGGASGISAYAAVGKPYGAFYATDVATDSLGRVIVDSATGTPLIAANVVYKGSYQPRFVASWGTTLTYRGFSLNVLFDTKQGGVFYSATKDLMGFVGTSAETENREPQVYPNSVYQNSQGNYVTNSTKYSVYNWYANSVIPDGQNVIDASYVKLREASLTYALPKGWLKRTPFGNASFSIFGNNLFLWTPSVNKYVDPEVNSAGATNLQGFDFRANPSLRNYGATLRMTF